jgi:hypothetical protein
MLHFRWPAAGRLVLALVAVGALGVFGSARPSLAQGDDDAWVPLTVVYTSDIKGKIEPCG